MNRRNFIKVASAVAGVSLLAGGGAIATSAASGTSGNSASARTGGGGKKIVVITGSPRRRGNTNHLAAQFIKGAEEAGHSVYRFDSARRKVSPCTACNHCGMDGDCVIDDDFTELRPRLLAADVVVFATPMYYFGFSAQLKRVIDRFHALNAQLKGSPRQAVFLMAYANTSPQEAEPMLDHYHALLRYLGWTDAGTVVAAGMWPCGAVEGTEYSRLAYELGRKI